MTDLAAAPARASPALLQKVAVAAAAMCINAVLYLVPNHLQLVEPRQLWWTRVDAWVPFLPATVWIYFSDYFLVSSAFLVSETWDEVKRFVRAYFVLLALGAVIHFAWPTVFPREAFPVTGSGLSARALASLRGVDAPTSCLPSMHVAGSYLAAFSLWHRRRSLFAGYVAWATTVALSTLTTKQHYLVDVLTGLGLAVALAAVFFWIPEYRGGRRNGWGLSAAPRVR
ncbi:MAG TPA: phosphatase PAP2 family protein [Myxococcaceae bacterium]|nr:phosphatase PAP2 family protein [Myxococcaceae bacterium]